MRIRDLAAILRRHGSFTFALYTCYDIPEGIDFDSKSRPSRNDDIVASTAFPGSAIFETMSAGIPQGMLVIEKPATVADAKPGYMNTTYLGQCVNEAKQKGWNAGLMT